MVALARDQKPSTESVILYLQIIGKLSVTTKLMLGASTNSTVSRLAWEIHHMVINAKPLECMKSVPTSYHLQMQHHIIDALKLRTATLMGAQ